MEVEVDDVEELSTEEDVEDLTRKLGREARIAQTRRMALASPELGAKAVKANLLGKVYRGPTLTSDDKTVLVAL